MAQITKQQKRRLARVLVTGVKLIRKIWTEGNDVNEEFHLDEAEEFIQFVDDSMSRFDD